MGIKVTATVKSTIEKVWKTWTSPDDIKVWNTASADWHTTHAEADLRVGGEFLLRMEAKDGSYGFDFKVRYTNIINHEMIEYTLEDGRKVKIEFFPTKEGIKIEETFDPEEQNPLEMQEQGWQSILNNFVKYIESK